MKRVGLFILFFMFMCLPCLAETTSAEKTDDLAAPKIFIYHIPDEVEAIQESKGILSDEIDVNVTPIKVDIVSDDVTADTSGTIEDSIEEEIVYEMDESIYQINDMYSDVLYGYASYDEEEPIVLEDSLEEYQALEARCSKLQSDLDSLQIQFNTLNEFKLSVERKDKEAMIAKFFMLSDEDKKDVVENIDTYSLEDIESKLSVICFRNKISFNTEEEKEEGKDTLTYSLKDSFDDNTMPAWVKAVKETQNSL